MISSMQRPPIAIMHIILGGLFCGVLRIRCFSFYIWYLFLVWFFALQNFSDEGDGKKVHEDLSNDVPNIEAYKDGATECLVRWLFCYFDV